MMFRPLLQAMRPRQWVKNVLVGAAPAAAGVTATTQWLDVLLAFISMTCAASGVYLFNDVADIAEDRLHPVDEDGSKHHRCACQCATGDGCHLHAEGT